MTVDFTIRIGDRGPVTASIDIEVVRRALAAGEASTIAWHLVPALRDLLDADT